MRVYGRVTLSGMDFFIFNEAEMKRIICLSLLAGANLAYADTYHFVGPTDAAYGYHMEVTFKVAGSLSPNTDYVLNPVTLQPSNIGLISGTIAVLDANGKNAGASTPVPISPIWIDIRTDANKLPQYWNIGSNVSQVTMVNNDPATSSGPWWQAYTTNGVAGWGGFGMTAGWEQYVYIIDYPVAQGCPAATPCNSSTAYTNPVTGAVVTVPMYSPFGWKDTGPNILSANTSAANWTVTPDAPVTPPVALSVVAGLPAATVGQSYSGTVTVANGTAPYTITVAGLPAGLSSNNGVITGTPSAAGTFTLSISVTDSVGDVGSTQAKLTVAPAPIVLSVSATLPAATVGVAYSGTVAATNGTAPYTVTVSGLPAGLSSNNGVISGTPAAAGSYAINATVTDSVGDSGSTSGVLTVKPAPVKLAVASAFPGATVGQAYSGSVAVANGTGPYTIAVSGLPSGLSNNNGVISGTPSTAGTYALIVSVSDSAGNTGSSTASLVVAAAPVTTPPATTPSCTAPAGSTAVRDIQANVTAVSGTTVTIGASVVTVPTCASISWQGNWSGLTKAIRVGYNVQVSKGYVLNGVTYATSLIVDNGL